MEIIMFILTLAGTIATIISTIIAIRAKNEVKHILKNIRQENNEISIAGDTNAINEGTNSGTIIGANSGVVNGDRYGK